MEAVQAGVWLAAGERIVGLDVRPANRQLLALTSTSRLYVISRSRASATAIGAGAFAPALAGSGIGFDFNPTVDRIRAVSAGAQNLCLHPATGAAAFTDGTLRYKDGVLTTVGSTGVNLAGPLSF